MGKFFRETAGIGLQLPGKTAIIWGKSDDNGGTALKRNRDENYRIHWLRDLLCGALIGAGAILPGVSGGVLAVVFDIYRPFMELLTHPRAAIPKYWRWFLPIGLGCVAGFLGD